MIHPDLAVAIRDALALAGTPEDDSVRGCLFLIIESCVSPRGPAGGNWGRFARLRACAKPHGHDGPWHRYGIVLRTWERLPSGRWADLPHAPYGVEAPDGPPGMSGERARVG